MIEALSQDECSCLQIATVNEHNDLEELSRDLNASIDPVIVVEDWAPKDTDPEIVDIGIGENSILQLSPDAFPAALVEIIHLGGDIREDERVTVCLRRLIELSPAEICPTGNVPSVKPVVLIEVIVRLKLGWNVRVNHETDSLPAEASNPVPINIPRYPRGEPAFLVECKREVCVIDDLGAVPSEEVVATRPSWFRESNFYPEEARVITTSQIEIVGHPR